jgi:hypothetical protein
MGMSIGTSGGIFLEILVGLSVGTCGILKLIPVFYLRRSQDGS